MTFQDLFRIKNGQVLCPDGALQEADIVLRGGQIEAVGPGLVTEAEIDAAGHYVLPGLIDLHTHGMRGQSAETGDLIEYAKIMAEFGTTTFYPTLFCHPSQAARHMERHLHETGNLERTPAVGGFRLESPYLAIPSGGTDRDVAPISDVVTRALLHAGQGYIKLWDVSPELEGAPALIRKLSAQGIVCSIAHTKATIAQGRAAVDAGARLVTHLFDVFYHTPEHKDPDPDIYAPSLVDYLLIEDRVTCEIIGDGTHVDPLLVEKAFRCKGRDRLVFVTDSNLASGMPPGRYAMPGNWGDVMIRSASDGVRLPDRDMILAGSALSPIDGFHNAVRTFGKDMATASRTCSTNPAQLMGLNKGEIAAGRDADLIVLDGNLDLVYTIAGGLIVWRV
jgi:N-acetylglucosamine-6-phosphate deacetylase